ncbi:hypothetical protein Tco_0766508 [Tanacetum coccineum]
MKNTSWRLETLRSSLKEEEDSLASQGTTKRPFKEAETTKTKRVKGSGLDAEIQNILLKNVQSHRETRTKENSLEVLGAIAVKKMMKKSKTKHISWLKYEMRYVPNPLTLVMKTHQ